MTARNVFEAEGRALKVASLCRAIDRELAGVETDTGRHAIVEFLAAQDRKWWLALARKHGIRSPSQLTIDCVVSEYRARAEEAEREDAVAEREEALTQLEADMQRDADIDDAFERMAVDGGWE